MKQTWKRTFGAVMALSIVVGAAGVASAAKAQKQNVDATLYPECRIVIDGVERTFYNVNGEEVHPILCDGTTYLPVRAIGELMGENVDWNEETLTITIGGRRTTQATVGEPDEDAERKQIRAQLRPDFTVVVDDTAQTFRNVNGDKVYPLLYNGSTYLPVRSIGELMGKEVAWDGTNKTVLLGDDLTVTDADTFGNGQQQNGQNGQQNGQNQQAGQITAEEAKEIALDHADVAASKAKFVKAELDYDDGHWVYEVEFYTTDGKEYDYEISAGTGKILQYDYDAENWQPSDSDTLITMEEASEIALGRVKGATEDNLQIKLEQDDGRWIYEGEIRCDGKEYEFEIDGTTGNVLEWSAESLWD
jgi:uncharacterized membrane protein YkoI